MDFLSQPELKRQYGSNVPEIVFSDDEQDDTPNDTPTLEYILPFGKHQGTTTHKLICSKQGRSYIRYLLKWDALRPYARMQLEFAMAHYDTLKGSQHQKTTARKRRKN